MSWRESERPVIALTSEQSQTVERKFRNLATQWAELTAYCSNMGALRHHPVYHELVALGEPVVPLILRELERQPSASWFGLLAAITGEDPVPPELAGHVAAMARVWLEWGRQHGSRSGFSLTRSDFFLRLKPDLHERPCRTK
jgi:hypothetical protein